MRNCSLWGLFDSLINLLDYLLALTKVINKLKTQSKILFLS
ncbi:hypothetical protein FTS_1262 [Francisella tularensis subsp. holarctica FSC200]|nr:hypothetical protein FTH_1262 [Francisella tularensis subsp. holarctica OSU18]ABU61837.1 hypothetical protein FTA_1362 [Francisella tularensis subsp. holarctica FTNF002-00]AFT93010.1 hypothetical protein FTS_1262 [Francisella tularensis subsp. holarctica FSC200]